MLAPEIKNLGKPWYFCTDSLLYYAKWPLTSLQRLQNQWLFSCETNLQTYVFWETPTYLLHSALHMCILPLPPLNHRSMSCSWSQIYQLRNERHAINATRLYDSHSQYLLVIVILFLSSNKYRMKYETMNKHRWYRWYENTNWTVFIRSCFTLVSLVMTNILTFFFIARLETGFSWTILPDVLSYCSFPIQNTDNL